MIIASNDKSLCDPVSLKDWMVLDGNGSFRKGLVGKISDHALKEILLPPSFHPFFSFSLLLGHYEVSMASLPHTQTHNALHLPYKLIILGILSQW